MNVKMPIKRKDPIHLKWIPSQIFSESAKLENKLHHRKVLGNF